MPAWNASLHGMTKEELIVRLSASIITTKSMSSIGLAKVTGKRQKRVGWMWSLR